MSIRYGVVLATLFVFVGRVFAQAAPPTPPAPPPNAAPTPAPADKPAGNFDFDLFDDGKKPATPALDFDPKKLAREQQIEKQIKVRRKMLLLHQGFGFATLGIMAATLIIGQLNYMDKYGGGDLTGRYQPYHLTLGVVTAASFATTGILGVGAPQPFPKKLKADRALFHKVMMALATAGMVAQLTMGPITAALDGNLQQRNLALGHLVAGYATWGFMASGMLAFVF